MNEKMSCPYCGETIDEGSTKCPSCAEQLVEAAAAAPAPAAATATDVADATEAPAAQEGKTPWFIWPQLVATVAVMWLTGHWVLAIVATLMLLLAFAVNVASMGYPLVILTGGAGMATYMLLSALDESHTLEMSETTIMVVTVVVLVACAIANFMAYRSSRKEETEEE